MKKRTKITLRTKIYLPIVGLLALTGVLYASTPSIFVSPGHGLDTPIGLAADPTHLFSSQYNDNEVITIDCLGNGTLFGTLPAPIPPLLTEKYMAIAPAQSTAAGFTPGDLFITLSQTVFTARPSVSGNFTLFATWAECRRRLPQLGPQRDYVRQNWAPGPIWQQNDHNVRGRPRFYD